MLESLVTWGSVVLGFVGIVFASKGATRTQAALLKGGERDGIIDAMAWIDRKVFRASR